MLKFQCIHYFFIYYFCIHHFLMNFSKFTNDFEWFLIIFLVVLRIFIDFTGLDRVFRGYLSLFWVDWDFFEELVLGFGLFNWSCPLRATWSAFKSGQIWFWYHQLDRFLFSLSMFFIGPHFFWWRYREGDRDL